MSIKFLIVIAAHNEEYYLPLCLASLENQLYKNFQVVVVDDGSSDRTPSIAKEFSERDSRFSLVRLPKSAHAPGAKIVKSFYKGLDSVDRDSFDVYCKFDADIVFPASYLEEIAHLYEQHPSLGMASGLVRICTAVFDPLKALDFEKEAEKWKYENLSDPSHVRGPIKSYRKECFEAMGGIRPTLGWDNIDSMLSKMHGFEVQTIKSLWVKHLRPTAERYKGEKAKKLGQYFYNIGLSFPLAFISAAKAASRSGGVKAFFQILSSFSSQKEKRELSEKEIKYIQKLRWNQFFEKLKWKN